jgi:serine/threonine protein kinase
MQKIKLRKETWEYEPTIMLGLPGGFGTVFLGYNAKGEKVAVKKLHISSGATGNRELVIAEELSGKNFRNIIPFYDSGIDADTSEYYVVMAKAEKSLQELIKVIIKVLPPSYRDIELQY